MLKDFARLENTLSLNPRNSSASHPIVRPLQLYTMISQMPARDAAATRVKVPALDRPVHLLDGRALTGESPPSSP